MGIEEAVANAQRQFLGMEGIVGISYSGNNIIFYVESEQDKYKVPSSYLGYNTTVVISGRFGVL